VAEFFRPRGFTAQKLEVIPNGVDVGRFEGVQPIELAAVGMPGGRRAIVFVGRLHEQKGLHDFLASSAELFAALPNHDLVVVGDGPQREALQQLVSNLRLADRVHFAGWRNDVPAVLAAADLLVLPARWEGMPNVVLEAMAAARPVVATRAEGVAELLGEASGEQTAEVGDMQGLISRIIQLVQNAQLAARLGQENCQRVLGEFSLQKMVSSYERLYARLLFPE
jgi:starch synthase (maltosyl-transferring)